MMKKHILVEKPISLSEKEVQNLEKISKKIKRKYLLITRLFFQALLIT